MEFNGSQKRNKISKWRKLSASLPLQNVCPPKIKLEHVSAQGFPTLPHTGTQQPEGAQKLSVHGAQQVCIARIQIPLQADQLLFSCLISNSCQILSGLMPISRYLLVFQYWHEDFFSIILPLQHGMFQLSLKDHGTAMRYTNPGSPKQCQWL